jgi:formamidopyrimidine-DNA glycosylase
MPELPEVEAVVRSLKANGLEGSRLKSAKVLRASVARPQTARELETLTVRTTILAVERRAKNILIHLSNGRSIRIHLRMTGDVTIKALNDPEPAVTRVVWILDGKKKLLFTDGRALGSVHVYPTSELKEKLANLGPEPLGRSFTVRRFVEIAGRSRLAAKLFLMDQTKIAGLGNIYAAEALFKARISPTVAICSLSFEQLKSLHLAVRSVLRSAVQSVDKAYRLPGGFRHQRNHLARSVYGRRGKPCAVCGSEIQRISQGGRSTYFCARCQPGSVTVDFEGAL